MGSQEQKTAVVGGGNPHWNSSMQFLIKDLSQDILCLTVFDRDYFSPDEFLGRTEIRIEDIIEGCEERRGPVTRYNIKKKNFSFIFLIQGPQTTRG